MIADIEEKGCCQITIGDVYTDEELWLGNYRHKFVAGAKGSYQKKLFKIM
jgi:hypothetical protein